MKNDNVDHVRVNLIAVVWGILALVLGVNRGLCASVSGVVLDAEGLPVRDRSVYLMNSQYMDLDTDSMTDTRLLPRSSSDEMGNFCFSNVAAGAYQIVLLPPLGEISSNSLVYRTIAITVSNSISELEFRPAVISKRVLHGKIRSVNKGALLKVRMRIMSANPAEVGDAALLDAHAFDAVEVNEEGLFSKQILFPGEYAISIIDDSLGIQIPISANDELIVSPSGEKQLENHGIKLRLWWYFGGGRGRGRVLERFGERFGALWYEDMGSVRVRGSG
jgi:hypothetical protein